MEDFTKSKLKYLELLSEKFPTIQSVCTEIINLKAILNLPKGTEQFLSDLHGEYESFLHILKNASGVIRTRIDETFENSMVSEQRRRLATLIYYPEEKLRLIKKENPNKNLNEFYKITLYRLVKLCRIISSKYSRSKVRKAMPAGYEYILDELLHADLNIADKELYYNQIVDTIIKLDRSEEFIIALSKLIQQLAIDHLHIIGDIYDRGPGPHIIIDKLINYHSIDLQWGNHDIIWMGAACGHPGCIFNVIRICARYDNLDILEDGYGINIRTITEFAKNIYKNDNCERFMPHIVEDSKNGFSKETLSKTQKAAAIIQFKLEGQIIKNHPEYKMENRLLLDKMDLKNHQININGKNYKMLDTSFPTVNLNDPYKLTNQELEVVNKLVKSFKNSEKLQRHIKFFYNKGSLYNLYNGNLLIHACVPVDAKGNLVEVEIDGQKLKGKKYLDKVDKIARQAFFAPDDTIEKNDAMDFMWYLWCGKDSPLFGKDAMKTFERYFVEDESTWKENKNPFYSFTQNEDLCRKILKEFGLDDENGHIICGHVPIKSKVGESPIKANGKLLMIDGGLSKAYQKATGIAGYTLIYNSYGLILTAHQKFSSTEDAIKNELDIYSTKQIVEKVERKYIADTDRGQELKEQIKDLNDLLIAYRNGDIKQGKK